MTTFSYVSTVLTQVNITRFCYVYLTCKATMSVETRGDGMSTGTYLAYHRKVCASVYEVG